MYVYAFEVRTMELSLFSAPRTMTYAAGDDKYILEIPEVVPVFIKDANHKYIKFHTMEHDESKLGRTYEIVGKMLYIALESADMLPIYAGYTCNKQPRPLTPAEKDAKIEALECEIECLKEEIGEFRRFMKVMKFTHEHRRQHYHSWFVGLGDIDYYDRGLGIDATVYITYIMQNTAIDHMINIMSEDMLHVSALCTSNKSSFVPNFTTHDLDGHDAERCFLYLLETVNKLPKLYTLQIGRPYDEYTRRNWQCSHGEEEIVDVRDDEIVKVRDDAYKCVVGYKYFEAISRTGIEELRFGAWEDFTFEVRAEDAQDIWLLMKENDIDVIISGLPKIN